MTLPSEEPSIINSCFAAGIDTAELQGGCAAERMPNHAEPLDIQPAHKLAGWISGIQSLQLAHHKLRIAGPHRQKSVNQAIPLVAVQILGIVRWRSCHYAFVREDGDKGSVRRVKAHDDVAATCQVLSTCREVCSQSPATSPHDHDWIRALTRRDVPNRCAMGPDQRQISREELTD